MGTVVTTWEQIEEPTFFRYLIEHGSSANIVVDTSDLMSMAVIEFAFQGHEDDEVQQALEWEGQVLAAERAGRADLLRNLAEAAPNRADSVRVMTQAGRLFKGQRKFKKALACFDRALSWNEKSWPALTQRTLMLERLERVAEARKRSTA